VAPSPTGDPHLGTAFVALMNALWAKKNGGKFYLRIEDTDRARSSKASEDNILSSLTWLGLTWDNVPVRQSDRLGIYHDHINTLLDNGHAFRCFCSKDDLDAMRNAQRAAGKPPRYDGRCAHLSDDDIKAHLDKGTPYVVRLKMPTTGTCTFDDRLRGTISFDWNEMDWPIIQKSDGWPTYHAANVIDDHLMGVTDVIRGEEWIPSTPKHIWLYSCFGWDAPRFTHLPLLRNPDKSKLSKRKNPTSITHYKDLGYLPEALRAFLLSFATKSEVDIDPSDLSAIEAAFDLSNLSLGGPVFDVDKLNFVNGKCLRAKDTDSFKADAHAWLDKDKLSGALALAHTRIEKMSDLPHLIAFLFCGKLGLDKDTLMDGKLTEDELASALATLSVGMDLSSDWSRDDVETLLRRTADIEGVPFKKLVRHLYIVFTGTPHSLPLFESMDLLGKTMCTVRLNDARALLAPVGKKKMDAKAKLW
jgi:glutamyl-tRNA synthetase